MSLAISHLAAWLLGAAEDSENAVGIVHNELDETFSSLLHRNLLQLNGASGSGAKVWLRARGGAELFSVSETRSEARRKCGQPGLIAEPEGSV